MNTKFCTANLSDHLGSKFHLGEAKKSFVHEAPETCLCELDKLGRFIELVLFVVSYINYKCLVLLLSNKLASLF